VASEDQTKVKEALEAVERAGRLVRALGTVERREFREAMRTKQEDPNFAGWDVVLESSPKRKDETFVIATCFHYPEGRQGPFRWFVERCSRLNLPSVCYYFVRLSTKTFFRPKRRNRIATEVMDFVAAQRTAGARWKDIYEKVNKTWSDRYDSTTSLEQAYRNYNKRHRRSSS